MKKGIRKFENVVIIFTAVAFLVTMVAFLVKYTQNKKEKERLAILDKKVATISLDAREMLESLLSDVVSPSEIEDLNSRFKKALEESVIYAPMYLTEAEVKKIFKEKFNELKNQLEKIEKRFPEEATLEKIASVNDAILGTKIETLIKSMGEIKSNMLTAWDVVKIVFGILSGLGFLTSLIFGGINLLRKQLTS